PPPSEFVRIDTGVRAGDEISQFYDPMIAKLVVWGDDRASALRRLRRSLASYQVVGVTTNISFLQRVVAHPAFATARFDTGLIARHQAELLAPPAAPSPQVLAVAAIGEFLRLVDAAMQQAQASEDRFSPWHAVDPWWLNSAGHAISLTYSALGMTYQVRLRVTGGDILVSIAGAAGAAEVDLRASASRRGEGMAITLDGAHLAASVVPLGDQRYVFVDGQLQKFTLVDPMAHASDDEHRGGHLTAPMSGTIVAVLVKAGDAVTEGAPLLILEAMKMEHTINAPAAGTVSAVHYRQGDQVSEGVDLIDVDAANADISDATVPTA
ncbi:MAG TPA: biotin/lipoyl-containing protein, partial [Casimicrobiaceae bacterium]